MKNIKAKKTKNIERFQNLNKAGAMGNLIKIIHFIGDTCAKITGLLDENEIFEALKKKFMDSKRYALIIFLLTDNESKLKIEKTSLSARKLKAIEKITGFQLEGYKIDLDKSSIYSQVAREGKIVQASAGDIVGELFPPSIACLISKTMGYKKKNCILAPLHRGKKIIGVIAMSSTQLVEHLIPLMKSFVHHISQSLELAEEDAKRRQAEKTLRKSEKKLQNIIASSPDSITATDLKGNITECNQATLNMHGFSSKKELIGKSAFKLIAQKDHQRALENIKKILKQGYIKDIEYTFLTKKGYEFPAELSASVVKDPAGKPIAFIAITKNIFRRKQIDRDKSEFVSIASHQLRTPLAIISWYSEMLLAEKAGKLGKQQGKYLEEIYKAIQRLVKLMNLLLNISRIELGTFRIEPEPVNLMEIAESAISELSPQIENKRLKIEKSYSENPLVINADPNIMKIIFQNLLSNAVRYVPNESKVRILIEKQKSYALIKISDNGYGIPKAQRAKIFKKFFRADNIIEKEPDGTGLGLYIVKLVLEKSGGKVWFESEENKSTTFYVMIPLKGMKKKRRKKRLNN